MSHFDYGQRIGYRLELYPGLVRTYTINKYK